MPIGGRGRRHGRATIVAAIAAIVATAPRAARALDAFEIQVYDGSADPAGAAGLELHVNGVVRGATTADPPELPPNHQSHFTLEPSYGVRPFWELGGYLQTALRTDGVYELAGVKLRSKLVTTSDWWPRGHLGVNVEVSRIPARYEAARWGIEVRPIFAYSRGRFSVATNPIVDLAPTEGGVAFEPATQLLFVFPGVASIGFEHYADFGDFSSSAWRDQQQYLFEVVNVLSIRDFELNAGVGEGLTPASNAFIAKAILGYTFALRRR